jgi:hypothetical protein
MQIDDEDPVVRQYRFLLRTAPLDALEAAHVEALEQLSPRHRAAVLATVQRALVAGLRLTPDRVKPLAHLLTSGEHRQPGAVIWALEAEVLRDLADRIILTEASFGLFGRYAAWDGAEPEPQPEPWAQDGFGEKWRESLGPPVLYKGAFGNPSSADTYSGYPG